MGTIAMAARLEIIAKTKKRHFALKDTTNLLCMALIVKNVVQVSHLLIEKNAYNIIY